MKHKKLLVAGLSALMLAGCGGTDSEKTTDTTDSKDAPQEETKVSNDVKVGETGEADGIKLTVTSVETNAGSDFVAPDDGNIFLVAHVKIQNDSSDKLDVSTIEFKLDQNGVEQDVDFMGSSLDGVTLIDSVTLKTGASVEGDLVFQVPADYSGGAVLEYFKNVVWDDKPIITVKL